jgi:hypothetical protein
MPTKPKLALGAPPNRGKIAGSNVLPAGVGDNTWMTASPFIGSILNTDNDAIRPT